MALPLAMLGIPWLASIITAAFTGLFSFFLKFFTKRLAIVLAVVAGIVALTTALFASLTALINSLSVAVPSAVQHGMALLMPDNTVICISAIISGHVIRYAYDWNIRVIEYKLAS